ncbi:MAG: hypothetical protein ACKOQM_02300 [Novosphingobium sp.]
MAEAESDDGTGSPESGNAEGEIAPSPTLAAEPVLTEAKAPGAGPSSAAEAGQLMASSRNRSGGVDQGDEPIRAPAR